MFPAHVQHLGFRRALWKVVVERQPRACLGRRLRCRYRVLRGVGFSSYDLAGAIM